MSRLPFVGHAVVVGVSGLVGALVGGVSAHIRLTVNESVRATVRAQISVDAIAHLAGIAGVDGIAHQRSAGIGQDVVVGFGGRLCLDAAHAALGEHGRGAQSRLVHQRRLGCRAVLQSLVERRLRVFVDVETAEVVVFALAVHVVAVHIEEAD